MIVGMLSGQAVEVLKVFLPSVGWDSAVRGAIEKHSGAFSRSDFVVFNYRQVGSMKDAPPVFRYDIGQLNFCMTGFIKIPCERIEHNKCIISYILNCNTFV
jgi:hypothetical protein